MMEPAALGKPTVVGKYTDNFEPEMELLLSENAAIQVEDEKILNGVLKELLGNPERSSSLGKRARETVLKSQGAADRCLERLAQVL